MEKKRVQMSTISVLQWLMIFAVALSVAVPFTTKTCLADGNTYRVSVATGYLALRSSKAYDSSNEIGRLYSGDTVTVSDSSDGTYWYVYSSSLGKSGYVNRQYLQDTGSSSSGSYSSGWTVSVNSGYLALRSSASFNPANEIGKLYSGDTVQVTDSGNAYYWYVYAPSLGKNGYVDKRYLVGGSSQSSGTSTPSSSGNTRTVSVSQGYLALRNAKAYDSSNEIGKLYSGDTVELINTSDGTYWYVYSNKLGMNGYVNKDYLTGGGSVQSSTGGSDVRTVSVSKGYLALRNAKAYDSSNEIGRLYSGDTVQISDSSDGTYWYVYSPSLGKSGYVNKNYLTGGSTTSSSSVNKTVRVSSGYLALRNAKAYSSSNEIGKLYTGDTVQVSDSSDGTYWYVYSPSLGKSGYVNKNYLY